jgi:hypothetical protein
MIEMDDAYLSIIDSSKLSSVVSSVNETADHGKVITRKKQWLLRQTLIPVQKNVTSQPLVNPENVFLPPLHIKFGLMKNFVKATNQNGSEFFCLKH